MIEETKDKAKEGVTAEIIFFLAQAFEAGVRGGFLAREHATAIFKSTLRGAGYEIPNKKEKESSPDAIAK